MSRLPHMAVVVMGYRNAATITAAVRSVVEQDAPEPFEVLVVTSGGDHTAGSCERSSPPSAWSSREPGSCPVAPATPGSRRPTPSS
jgi:hypothetical protein